MSPEDSDPATDASSPDGASGPFEAVGNRLLESMLSEYVEPEIRSRNETGDWDPGLPVWKFQVSFEDDGSVQVLLNDEVKGQLTARLATDKEAGDEVVASDIAEITTFSPEGRFAQVPYVAGFFTNETWFVAFEFGGRHPMRHRYLEAGQDFLRSAHENFDAGRPGVSADNAFSAAELLARTELLSSSPAIKHVLAARGHAGLSQLYNAWAGYLENSDREFSKALNVLARIRPAARYLERDLDVALLPELLETLDKWEELAKHLATAPLRELPRSYNMVAAREISHGELVEADDSTIYPPKREPKDKQQGE